MSCNRIYACTPECFDIVGHKNTRSLRKAMKGIRRHSRRLVQASTSNLRHVLAFLP